MSGDKVDLVIVNPTGNAAQWAEAGVRKVVLDSYEGMLESHNRVLCYRAPGATGAEVRGTYQTHEWGEPLRSVREDAHARGLEVHPYGLVGIAGVWMGSRRAQPPSRLPLASVPRFAMEHPEYMSRARDGRSWLDWEIGEHVLGYDVGYMGLAYPEVREYERAAFVEYVRDYRADGVQLEFVPVLTEGEETWPLGYDEPALRDFKEAHGVNPRTLDNADELWTRFRAGYYTQFVRELREDLSNLGRKVTVSVATGGVWADPDGAYKLMVDWPTWVEEGLIDELHPKFWITDPYYPLSYPASETGSWYVTPERIKKEISTVRETVGDKCLIYGTAECKNGGGGVQIDDLTGRIVDAADAVMEAGSDGFSIYTDAHVMSYDEFWESLARISSGR